MYILQCWLQKHFKNELDIEKLKEVLDKHGYQVSSEIPSEQKLEKVIIGQILKIEPHPNADRLVYCEVITGTDIHHIVCGANNMVEGDKVPVALPGANLPNGIKIKKSKIRGVASEGMLCSPIELGMGDDAAGLMILPEDVSIGDKLSKYLDLSGNILEITSKEESDTTLSVKELINLISLHNPIQENI